MTVQTAGFADLSRPELAVLVPELLLAGQLIDRSALAHVLVALGPDGMRDVAIEEWMGASPVYTRRMQRALGFAPRRDGAGDVVTIFKGLQLDIGAPPQFMDFRYSVTDAWHGAFELAHCGALMDVEPMGEAYVTRMCHDIEDPTFDATAVASNPRAQVRPVHRPPRVPADRTPHCRWTVTIDESHPALDEPQPARIIARSHAATLSAVIRIDASEEGAADYSGPLVSDVDFAAFSRSALQRIAEEVCLQMHLLVLSFRLAVGARVDAATELEIVRKGFTGIAGLTAERLRTALHLGDDLAAAATLLRIHPATNPAAYAGFEYDLDDRLLLRWRRDSLAHADGAWPALVDADYLEPVQAILRAVDPHLRADVVRADDAVLELAVVRDDAPHAELPEVTVTRFSSGAAFRFVDPGHRPALPVL
jgi:hypothetical protein